MSEARNRKVGFRGYASRRRYPEAGKSTANSPRRQNTGPLAGKSAAKSPRKLKIGVLLGTLAVVAAICVGAFFLFKPASGIAGPGGTATPDQRAILDDDRFYHGIFVDGIALGGLTRDEARARIEANLAALASDIAVTVVCPDGSQNRLPLSSLPEGAYAFDTDKVLEEAYKIGREGTDEERLAFIERLPENPVELKTPVKYADPSSLEQAVRDLTLPYYVAPIDAAFDPTAPYDTTKEGVERLTFKPAVEGSRVNPDALWEAVKGEFTGLTFGTVEMKPEPVPPAITVDDLKADMQLMHWENIPAYDSNKGFASTINIANEGHTFTTLLKNDKEARRTNISLANDAVSGLLMPGEIFDFNQRTGIRDAAHGYVKAPVDIGGKEDVGLGGGVCQVSSTLYNAVIRYGGKYEADGGKSMSTKDQPGLAVIERDNHSVPSGYVMRGTDATVDMALPSGQSRKNLRFRNDFDKPVLIVLYLEKMKIGKSTYWFEHCDIYGPPLPGGYTYDLVGKKYHRIPRDMNFIDTHVSDSAKPGNPKYMEGHDGFTIQMWIEKKLNGELVESFHIYTDYCEPQSPYYIIARGETPPAPIPTPMEWPTYAPPPEPTTAQATEPATEPPAPPA